MNDSVSVRWRDPWVWGPLVCALLLYAVLLVTSVNQAAFLWLNHLSAYTGDRVWAQITILGDGLTVAAVLLPWARRHPRLVWAGLVAAILAGLWVHGIKHSMPMPRPAAVLPAGALHVIGQTYYAGSFPSGHATAIFALAALFALGCRMRWRSLLLLLAVVVACSRSVVGAHWPLDLAGGMFGGWLAAVLALRLAAGWEWTTGRAGRITALVFLSLAALVLPFYHMGYEAARPLQIALGVGLVIIAALNGTYHWRVLTAQRA
jgi:membrane-associated phospholipid phosphatase